MTVSPSGSSARRRRMPERSAASRSSGGVIVSAMRTGSGPATAKARTRRSQAGPSSSTRRLSASANLLDGVSGSRCTQRRSLPRTRAPDSTELSSRSRTWNGTPRLHRQISSRTSPDTSAGTNGPRRAGSRIARSARTMSSVSSRRRGRTSMTSTSGPSTRCSSSEGSGSVERAASTTRTSSPWASWLTTTVDASSRRCASSTISTVGSLIPAARRVLTTCTTSAARSCAPGGGSTNRAKGARGRSLPAVDARTRSTERPACSRRRRTASSSAVLPIPGGPSSTSVAAWSPPAIEDAQAISSTRPTKGGLAIATSPS